MSQSKALLSRFVGTGGVTGGKARYYAGNAKNSALFLYELKHKMKTNRQRMEEIWGKKLIKDLEKFS